MGNPRHQKFESVTGITRDFPSLRPKLGEPFQNKRTSDFSLVIVIQSVQIQIRGFSISKGQTLLKHSKIKEHLAFLSHKKKYHSKWTHLQCFPCFAIKGNFSQSCCKSKQILDVVNCEKKTTAVFYSYIGFEEEEKMCFILYWCKPAYAAHLENRFRKSTKCINIENILRMQKHWKQMINIENIFHAKT